MESAVGRASPAAHPALPGASVAPHLTVVHPRHQAEGGGIHVGAGLIHGQVHETWVLHGTEGENNGRLAPWRVQRRAGRRRPRARRKRARMRLAALKPPCLPHAGGGARAGRAVALALAAAAAGALADAPKPLQGVDGGGGGARVCNGPAEQPRATAA